MKQRCAGPHTAYRHQTSVAQTSVIRLGAHDMEQIGQAPLGGKRGNKGLNSLFHGHPSTFRRVLRAVRAPPRHAQTGSAGWALATIGVSGMKASDNAEPSVTIALTQT
jgi:hypothetical protein